jgi:16S rRNA (guanine527-N7)-methyltransferase
MIDYSSFAEILNTVLADNGLSAFCREEESRKFYDLTEHMLKVNESMNLTAIKEEKAIALRHYADSLTVSAFLPQNAKIIDIGCGAGFPSLPLAICRPDLSITALDSTEKRIRYVNETAQLLGCTNLTALAMRAEDGAHQKDMRERFDVCTARAVAALPVLAELCLPYVKLGGRFIAMKALKGEEELSAAQSAIKRLGGEVKEIHRVTLTGDGQNDVRMLIEIKKIKPTPADLPRAYAKICKKPL